MGCIRLRRGESLLAWIARSVAALALSAPLVATVVSSPLAAEQTPPSAPKYTTAAKTVVFEVEKGDWFGTLNTTYEATAFFVVANEGDTAGTGAVASAFLSDGSVVALDEGNLPTIPAKAVSEVTLSFEWKDTQPTTGSLAVSDPGSGADLFVVPFAIEITVPPWLIAVKTISNATLSALLTLVLVHGAAEKKARSLGKKLDLSMVIKAPDKWSFKDSFATNVTAIGAIVTTILAASGFTAEVLPGLRLGFFVAMSLLFGFGVLLGPAAYSALADDEGNGTYRGLLVSAAITTWAVVGQLSTVSVMVHRGGVPFGWGVLSLAVSEILVLFYMTKASIALVMPSLKTGPGVSMRSTTF